MSRRAVNCLLAHVSGDEQVLWSGTPEPGAFVLRHWRHSVFGLFWLAVSVMWFVSIAAGGLPRALCLLVLPFLGLALWMTVGHILWAAMELPNVAYVLTNWRVLMSYGWPRVKTRTIPLARIAELDLWPRNRGYGDIRLGVEVGYFDGARWSKAGGLSWGQADTVLRGLAACADVYSQLCAAIRSNSGRGVTGRAT